jgi:hypothetical protein
VQRRGGRAEGLGEHAARAAVHQTEGLAVPRHRHRADHPVLDPLGDLDAHPRGELLVGVADLEVGEGGLLGDGGGVGHGEDARPVG